MSGFSLKQPQGLGLAGAPVQVQDKKKMCTKSTLSYNHANLLIEVDLRFAVQQKWFNCDIKNGQTWTGWQVKTHPASPTERRQHRGWKTTWPVQRMDRSVSGWSAARCRYKPPPASASHPWQVRVCQPWRTHPTLTPLGKLSVVHSNAVTGILRWAKLTGPTAPTAETSDGGAGLPTAEDHGRRGSHHPEEGRVLGALVRGHSCTFLGVMRLRGRLCSSYRRFPYTAAWDRLKHGREART